MDTMRPEYTCVRLCSESIGQCCRKTQPSLRTCVWALLLQTAVGRFPWLNMLPSMQADPLEPAIQVTGSCLKQQIVNESPSLSSHLLLVLLLLVPLPGLEKELEDWAESAVWRKGKWQARAPETLLPTILFSSTFLLCPTNLFPVQEAGGERSGLSPDKEGEAFCLPGTRTFRISP